MKTVLNRPNAKNTFKKEHVQLDFWQSLDSVARPNAISAQTLPVHGFGGEEIISSSICGFTCLFMYGTPLTGIKSGTFESA